MNKDLKEWLDICKRAGSILRPEAYQEWKFKVGMEGTYKERAEVGKIVLEEIVKINQTSVYPEVTYNEEIDHLIIDFPKRKEL